MHSHLVILFIQFTNHTQFQSADAKSQGLIRKTVNFPGNQSGHHKEILRTFPTGIGM